MWGSRCREKKGENEMSLKKKRKVYYVRLRGAKFKGLWFPSCEMGRSLDLRVRWGGASQKPGGGLVDALMNYAW